MSASTPGELAQPGGDRLLVASRLTPALDVWGLPPTALTLEVTEGARAWLAVTELVRGAACVTLAALPLWTNRRERFAS